MLYKTLRGADYFGDTLARSPVSRLVLFFFLGVDVQVLGLFVDAQVVLVLKAAWAKFASVHRLFSALEPDVARQGMFQSVSFRAFRAHEQLAQGRPVQALPRLGGLFRFFRLPIFLI
jgi:hypothetical protein